MVLAPLITTKTWCFFEKALVLLSLSKSSVQVPIKRSSSFGCGVKIDPSGKNFNKVFFFDKIFKASASTTKGTLFFLRKSSKAIMVLSWVPKPTPIPTAEGLKFTAIWVISSSSVSVTTIASGNEVCIIWYPHFGKNTVTKPAPEAKVARLARAAAPILP